ncbi:MAG: hypothetical protein ACTSQE_10395 [Candidatus Heimdallarchaeaceae archaeon]
MALFISSSTISDFPVAIKVGLSYKNHVLIYSLSLSYLAGTGYFA